MAIRAIKVRLRPQNDSPEALADFRAGTNRIREISERIQEMFNRVWVLWRLWHEERRTPLSIRAALKELQAWHERPPKEREAKPKFKIEILPKELEKHITSALATEFPDVHVRTAGLLWQKVRKLILNTKSTRGTIPGNWSILLCRQGLPAATDFLPIPIDDANTKLRADGKRVTMLVRVDRIVRVGKRGASHEDIYAVYPAKRDFRGRKLLSELASGKREFRGSQLAIKDGAPVMFLAYEIPPDEQTKFSETAVVAPGKLASLNVRVKGRTIQLIKDVADVDAKRRNVQGQRWSRQSNYRHAGSSTKGHGRERALAAVTKLQQSWKRFQKTRNEYMAALVDRVLAENGVGKAIFLQPSPERGRATRRLLNVAGNIYPSTSTAGWDWFSFGAILSRRLSRNGVAVHQVKRP